MLVKVYSEFVYYSSVGQYLGRSTSPLEGGSGQIGKQRSPALIITSGGNVDGI